MMVEEQLLQNRAIKIYSPLPLPPPPKKKKKGGRGGPDVPHKSLQ